MGNPLPAEVYTIYTESNGLQKLLTYFLDSLPSSLNGIKHEGMCVRVLSTSLLLFLFFNNRQEFRRSLFSFSFELLVYRWEYIHYGLKYIETGK